MQSGAYTTGAAEVMVWLPECTASTNKRLENLVGEVFSDVLTERGEFGFAS
jgi:hypothetical protein